MWKWSGNAVLDDLSYSPRTGSEVVVEKEEQRVLFHYTRKKVLMSKADVLSIYKRSYKDTNNEDLRTTL